MNASLEMVELSVKIRNARLAIDIYNEELEYVRGTELEDELLDMVDQSQFLIAGYMIQIDEHLDEMNKMKELER